MLTVSPIQIRRYNPSFKENHDYTAVNVDGNLRTMNNFTGFMRNFETLEFTKDYIIENFPNGTHIAEFGCSSREKSYSLLTLLEEHNKNNRYKITGYDFPEVIDKYKSRIYNVEKYSKNEQIFYDNYGISSIYDYKPASKEDAEKVRQAFLKYFDRYEPKYNLTAKMRHDLECIIKNSKNLEKVLEAKRELDIFFASRENNTYVIPNQKTTNNLIEFKPGNIMDIDKILEKGKSGVVIFQNALYHILKGDAQDLDHKKAKVEDAAILFKKIHSVLPKNGIFVLGTLPNDHLYDWDMENQTKLKKVGTETLKVYEDTRIHKALREAGFEPIRYDNMEEGTSYCRDKYIKLPSVWRKV